MDIPLRDRNLLLQAAGYTSAYAESRLDDPVMAPVLAAPAFLKRLRGEARVARDPALADHVEALVELSGVGADEGPYVDNLLPVLPLEAAVGELSLSLFSVMSTIGTPQDITADELRVESFYPADDQTAAFFAAAGSAASH